MEIKQTMSNLEAHVNSERAAIKEDERKLEMRKYNLNTTIAQLESLINEKKEGQSGDF